MAFPFLNNIFSNLLGVIELSLSFSSCVTVSRDREGSASWILSLSVLLKRLQMYCVILGTEVKNVKAWAFLRSVHLLSLVGGHGFAQLALAVIVALLAAILSAIVD